MTASVGVQRGQTGPARADEARPRVSDSESNGPHASLASFLLHDGPRAPSDDLPLVLQVVGVRGGGVAALGSVRVAESPCQPLEEVAGGAHCPQLI